MQYRRRNAFLLGIALFCVAMMGATPCHGTDNMSLAKGQTVYVPAYSHIYAGNREQPLLLTVTLSIRNADLTRAITITKVDYYETQGKLLRTYLETPVTLKPLESTRYIVPERDKAGGSGANFIVAWHAQQAVNAPVIETVMIGTQSQQGISFTSRGQVIDVLP